jgi:Kef-type K+ transport system membrane component KefB
VAEHGELASLLIALALILIGAKLGGDIAQRLKQPAVLGELLAGLVMGNLSLVGIENLEFIGHHPMIEPLAELGVIVLLFDVGLGSTVAQMAQVGLSSMLVAVLGVAAPMVLGVGVGMIFLPEHSFYVHLFLGATLTATSVGITARVLKDLGHAGTKEAQVILGAAVIDDVLGLIILASVSGIIQAANEGIPLSLAPTLGIIAKAFLFLVTAVGLGIALTPFFYRRAARLQGGGILLGISLAFCFLLSWLASEVGLAPIVGAFAAGLILESAHYQPFTEQGERELEELVEPVSHFLSPIFFVLMGFKVELAAMTDLSALGLAAALVVAAVVGKQVCMLGVLDKKLKKLPIGLGMIPRGEVGLIFANIGLQLHIGGEGIISPTTFTAVVIMVMVTTLLTPPLLGWSLRGKPASL